jgi:tRNA nucleotidyltransferase/poly(A) polymerase
VEGRLRPRHNQPHRQFKFAGKLAEGRATVVQEVARDAVEHIADSAPQELLSHRAMLLATSKKASAWKPLLARLELLERLLPLLHVTKDRGSGGGLEAREVMAILGPALSHANASVRAAAMRLVVICFQEVVRL